MKQSLPFLLNYDAKIRLFQLSGNTWTPLFHNNCCFIDIHQLFVLAHKRQTHLLPHSCNNPDNQLSFNALVEIFITEASEKLSPAAL
jgi:hypothetical protein